MFARRNLAALVLAAAGLSAGQGLAQEDLNRGKTPAQLYASDCVDCHKNPRALGNRDNPASLSAFLRVHYTASRESASAIAAYLVSLGPEPRGSRPAGTASRPRPAQEQGKPEPAKSAAETAKPAEAAKPAETAAPKPAEPAAEKPAAPAAEPAPAPPAAPAAAPAPASPPADPQ